MQSYSLSFYTFTHLAAWVSFFFKSCFKVYTQRSVSMYTFNIFICFLYSSFSVYINYFPFWYVGVKCLIVLLMMMMSPYEMIVHVYITAGVAVGSRFSSFSSTPPPACTKFWCHLEKKKKFAFYTKFQNINKKISRNEQNTQKRINIKNKRKIWNLITKHKKISLRS